MDLTPLDILGPSSLVPRTLLPACSASRNCSSLVGGLASVKSRMSGVGLREGQWGPWGGMGAEEVDSSQKAYMLVVLC